MPLIALHEFMKYDKTIWAVLRLSRQPPRIMHVWEALMAFHEFMKNDKTLSARIPRKPTNGPGRSVGLLSHFMNS